MHVEIDRETDRGRPRRDRRRPAAGAARRPRGRRGLGEDARRRRCAIADELAADPPPLPEPRRSTRPASCCAGWPTTTSPSSATASTTSSATGDDDVAARPCPAPASASCADRPADMVRRRSASCRRRSRAKAREQHAAGADQGQLALHRAPPGLPRLRRRQDVRRRRRGRRRAPLPRAVLLRGLHRVASPRIPVLREQGRARCWTAPGFAPRQPRRQGPAARSSRPTRATSCSRPRSTSCAPIADRRAAPAGAPPAPAVPAPDAYGRFCPCLVYLPRDRYTTAVRLADAARSCRRSSAASVEFTARVTESMLARLHFVVRVAAGAELPSCPTSTTSRPRAPAGRGGPRPGRDDFADALAAECGEERGRRAARGATATRSPRPTRRTSPPRTARRRPRPARGARRRTDFALSLYEPVDAAPGERRLQDLPHRARRSRCPQVLPVLSADWASRSSTSGRTSSTRSDRSRAWIYDFGLRYDAGAAPTGDDAASCSRTPSPRSGPARAEIDGFNALVLGAGLTWRQATVLRAYAKYLRQAGSHVQPGLHRGRAPRQRPTSPGCWCSCSRRASTRPRSGAAASRGSSTRIAGGARPARSTTSPASTRTASCAPTSTLIKATLRTNYFQRDADGEPHAYMSFKLDPQAIPDLPEPRPRVRDLRLLAAGRGRAPALRRGRPRRPALVRPARGLPHRGARPGQGADGEEHRDRAGRRQGRLRRQAAARPGGRPRRVARRGHRLLQDVHLRRCSTSPTTSSTARSCRPRDVVRHDGDDPYLVVAADKGTATFSDIANGVAEDYGFWLGDAFASGGSVGYDHKAMGITARGAWESVQAALPRARRRHPDRGLHRASASATCPATCSATACCCSEHIRLVAAFDHRHIFLDPDPGRGDVVRRAAAAVRAAALELGRLRHRR